MRSLEERRDLLENSRLYFVTDAGVSDELVEQTLEGGVDILQLRDSSLSDGAVVAVAARFRELCERHDTLLFVNDRPDLALRAGADGVHVGQDDMPITEAREVTGGELLIGLSTHSRHQLERGIQAGADQLSVGPVWETPTKPGRPATGLELVQTAAQRDPHVPWFAIGGIDETNVIDVAAAGAGRCVVVRAIRDAADPHAAARAIRAALEGASAGVAH